MHKMLTGVLAGLMMTPVACVGPERHGAGLDSAAPLFKGMGSHSRVVTTRSREAQRYFDQGLVWVYAFNHDEAIRSFREAARHDPECAMAWWGVALANGPHINFPEMTPEQSASAWEAIQKALALRASAGPEERSLIDALSKRYAEKPPADRGPLNEAYAEAMKHVWVAHPNDSDVGTLYTEALMNLQPWDLWSKGGAPKGRTPEILQVLESVLAMAPEHPGANHLYIHAVEGSPHPEKGVVSADRLRKAVPASGHLTHMPSHIDVKVGRWQQAVEQNEQAIAIDRRYRAQSPKQGFYRVYMAHNHHMLSFAAMMEGRSKLAIRAAREVIESVPADYMRAESALVDPYMGAVYDALKRFGRWDDILREPAPPAFLPITNAMWRFSRALAYAAKGEVERALSEQESFRAAVRRVPDDALMAINPAHKVLSIADHMLTGEIAYRRGEIDEAVKELRTAVEIEDDLLYMEPPEWIQPVRHTLGAVLVDAKRWQEAEAVYRRDLDIWPDNGWSLFGLSQSLRAQGKAAEADDFARRFGKTWARADTTIKTSCLCVSGV